ncbi:MAG TPA: amidohydrolase family protein [Candidatus Sulfotelmatobacter sp.]|nr:amidohydrolase family protein [Candidatus Sulfotelmatobacter sp.]
MMRIDAHQHFWIYNEREFAWLDDSLTELRRNFLPGDLEPELNANGFHGSVVVQTRQTLEESRWLLELAEHHSSILGVVGWADLSSPEIEAQLKDLTRHSKLVGLRHIVQSEPDERFLLRPEFLRGIAALEQFGLAFDILIYPRHLPVAVEFVKRFPRQRFVLDHMAKPPIRDRHIDTWAAGIRRLAAFPNVFCKASGLVTEAEWKNWKPEDIAPYLDVALESFGPERLMIGSDWPVCLVAGSYSRVTGLVKDYISQRATAHLADVLGENARRFWRLATL